MEHIAMQDRQKSNQRRGILKRRYQRTGVRDVVADIGDGNDLLGGLVTDISSGGFRMTHVTDTFAIERYSYPTIISSGGRYYKVLAKPCWHRLNSRTHSQEIGFKIVDASWEWTEFVLNAASDADHEDDWGLPT